MTVIYPKVREVNLNAYQFILGEYNSKADNSVFVLVINMMRFVWVSKCTGMQLNLENFKKFFNKFIGVQKGANILHFLQNMDTNAIWVN